MNLGGLIEQADYWRANSLSMTKSSELVPYKEWQHFVIFGPQWVLVFNLNLDGEFIPGGVSPNARVITIFSTDKWQGQVDSCADLRLTRGKMHAQFDDAGMRWENDSYHIWQSRGEVQLDIVVTPKSIPSLSHNIPLAKGSHLSWCLIPRLEASGWVSVNGEKIPFESRGAYHDHNWGRFHWGGDFSWEWGCALPTDPSDPWTFVFARMNTNNRNTTVATSAFLLHEGRHLRYFRNAEVLFATEGEANPIIAGRLPAAAALLLPDQDRDVAQHLLVRAERGNDWLQARISSAVRGQVLVPSEIDFCRVVRLNEASAEVSVVGQCAGQEISFDGPGLLEVVRV